MTFKIDEAKHPLRARIFSFAPPGTVIRRRTAQESRQLLESYVAAIDRVSNQSRAQGHTHTLTHPKMHYSGCSLSDRLKPCESMATSSFF
jgi:hypothetical protein